MADHQAVVAPGVQFPTSISSLRFFCLPKETNSACECRPTD
jgi:hypothetical protein